MSVARKRVPSASSDNDVAAGSYINVATPNNWLIHLDSIKLNGKTLAMPRSKLDSIAAIDSGTTSIIGPDSVVEAYHAQIPGAQRWEAEDTYGLVVWSIPCDTDAKVSLGFGGKDWQISASDLTEKSTVKGKEHYCLSTIQAFGTLNDGGGYPGWLVGVTFLKNVFAVFDGGDGKLPSRIGFAIPK